MALTNINSTANRLVGELRALGFAVTFVSDVWSGEDLPWRKIEAIEYAFMAAAITLAEVEAEVAVNPAAVQAAIVARGGPANLGAFGARIAALKASLDAWYNLVMAEVHALPTSSIVWSHSEPLYRQTRFIENLPESVGMTLKNSDQLAALRAELVALGAI